LLSQEKLLKVIAEDLRVWRGASHASTDAPGRERQSMEITTLTQHMKWAENANDDQAVLEEIVQSLEKNMVVRYQEWRQCCSSPIRCARHEKDFFLLSASSSVWDCRLIRRPAKDARRKREPCLGRVTSENGS
jgi:hypothetical protein